MDNYFPRCIQLSYNAKMSRWQRQTIHVLFLSGMSFLFLNNELVRSQIDSRRLIKFDGCNIISSSYYAVWYMKWDRIGLACFVLCFYASCRRSCCLSCCNVSVFCFMPVVVVVMMFVHLVLIPCILFGSVKFKFKCF